MESGMDWHAAYAALAWQVELGADEAIGEAPVDRFAHEAAERAARAAPSPPPAAAALSARPVMAEADPVAEATAAARAATTLEELRAALDAYPHCDLKRGARNLVFADGTPQARVMIVGEAPGREEDQQGLPFVGRAGQLLDRMLGAIGLSRAQSVYITNVLPWRPPQNRDPSAEEIAMMRPFVSRHIALVDPDLLVVMGNISCDALLGRRGISRLRGHWTEAEGRPALPMFHPAYLLRQPQMKRQTWADLLELQMKLRVLK
ncbi:uracil-DNA glycosylase [Salipiger marinus]|uniref:uracil-DNA glycosylase n=1 Tax=Salipiger marinus TaxID=555512 RepID=UPI004059F5E4